MNLRVIFFCIIAFASLGSCQYEIYVNNYANISGNGSQDSPFTNVSSALYLTTSLFASNASAEVKIHLYATNMSYVVYEDYFKGLKIGTLTIRNWHGAENCSFCVRLARLDNFTATEFTVENLKFRGLNINNLTLDINSILNFTIQDSRLESSTNINVAEMQQTVLKNISMQIVSQRFQIIGNTKADSVILLEDIDSEISSGDHDYNFEATNITISNLVQTLGQVYYFTGTNFFYQNCHVSQFFTLNKIKMKELVLMQNITYEQKEYSLQMAILQIFTDTLIMKDVKIKDLNNFQQGMVGYYIFEIISNQIYFTNFKIDNCSINGPALSGLILMNFQEVGPFYDYYGFLGDNITILNTVSRNTTLFVARGENNIIVPIHNFHICNLSIYESTIFSLESSSFSLYQSNITNLISDHSRIFTISGQAYGVFLNQTIFQNVTIKKSSLFYTSSYSVPRNFLLIPSFFVIDVHNITLKNSSILSNSEFFNIDKSHIVKLSNITLEQNLFSLDSKFIFNKDVVLPTFIPQIFVNNILRFCSNEETFYSYYKLYVDQTGNYNMSITLAFPLICGPMHWIALNYDKTVQFDVSDSFFISNLVLGSMLDLNQLQSGSIQRCNFINNNFNNFDETTNGVLFTVSNTENFIINENNFTGQNGFGYLVNLFEVMNTSITSNRVWNFTNSGFLYINTHTSDYFEIAQNIFYNMTISYSILNINFQTFQNTFSIVNNNFVQVILHSSKSLTHQVNLIGLCIEKGNYYKSNGKTVYSYFANNTMLGCKSLISNYNSQAFFNSLMDINAIGYFLIFENNLFAFNIATGNFKLMLTSVDFMTASDSLIYSNQAMGISDFGQGLFFLSGEQILIKGFSFIKNTIQNNGLISAQTNTQGNISSLPNIQIIKCFVYRNSGGQGTFMIIKNYKLSLYLVENVFLDNIIPTSSSLLFFKSSVVQVNCLNNKYYNQNFSGFGDIYLVEDCFFGGFFTNETLNFENNHASMVFLYTENIQTTALSPGLIMMSNFYINFSGGSKNQIFNGDIQEFTATNMNFTNFKIETCLFCLIMTDPHGINRKIKFIDINFENLTYKNHIAAPIYFSYYGVSSMNISIEVERVSANNIYPTIENEIKNYSLIFFQTDTITNMSISDSTFTNMNTTFGNVLNTVDDHKLTLNLYNNYFENLTAFFSGGAFVTSLATLNMINNTFLNCNSMLRGGSLFVNNAGRFNVSSFYYQNVIIGESLGPKFFMELGLFDPNKTQHFISVPYFLIPYAPDPVNSSLVRYDYDNYGVLKITGLTTYSLTKLLLTAYPLDFYYQNVVDETANSTIGLIIANKHSLMFPSYADMIKYISPKYLSLFSGNSNLDYFYCDLISCNISNQTFSLLDMTAGLQTNFATISLNSIPYNSIENDFIFEFNSTCPEGYALIQGNCQFCNFGSFSFNQSCHFCPNNAACPGGSRVELLQGFWSPNQIVPLSSIACPYPELCSGNNSCLTGRIGIQCLGCDIDNGYFANGLDCVQCQSSAMVFFANGILYLGTLGYMILTYYFTWEENKSYLTILESDENDGEIKEEQVNKKIERLIRGSYKKLLTFYFVIFSAVFGTFDQTIFRTWFDFVFFPFLNLFRGQIEGLNSVSYSASQVGSPLACVLYNNFGFRDEKSLLFASTYYEVLNPLVSLSILLLIIALYKKMRNVIIQQRGSISVSVFSGGPMLLNAIWAMSTVNLVNILRASIGFLSCLEPYPGYKGSSLNQNVSCEDPEYQENATIILFITIAYLAVYIFLIALYLFSKGRSPRTRNYTLSFAHIFSNFPNSKYWWGAVTILMTLVILFLSGKTQNDPTLKMILIISIILLYMSVYKVVEPSRIDKKERLAEQHSRNMSMHSYLSKHSQSGMESIQKLEKRLKSHTEMINRDENYVMELSLMNSAFGYIYLEGNAMAIKYIGIIAPIINFAVVAYLLFKIISNWRRIRIIASKIKNVKWFKKSDSPKESGNIKKFHSCIDYKYRKSEEHKISMISIRDFKIIN